MFAQPTSTTGALLALLFILAPAALAVEVTTTSTNVIEHGIDFIPEERIPVVALTLVANELTCTFTYDTPTCDFATITVDRAPLISEGYLLGKGFDGVSTYNTFFGNGSGMTYEDGITNEGQLTITPHLPVGDYNIQVIYDTTTRVYTHDEITFTQEAPEILIDENYPKNSEYIFICDQVADTYDWDFGNGEKLYDVTNNNVFHRYLDNGDYIVSCSATTGEITRVGYREITVTNAPEVAISAEVSDQTVTITCTTNYDATYDFDFSESITYDVTNNTQSYTYNTPGTYVVSCSATGDVTLTDATQITIEQESQIQASQTQSPVEKRLIAGMRPVFDTPETNTTDTTNTTTPIESVEVESFTPVVVEPPQTLQQVQPSWATSAMELLLRLISRMNPL